MNSVQDQLLLESINGWSAFGNKKRMMFFFFSNKKKTNNKQKDNIFGSLYFFRDGETSQMNVCAKTDLSYCPSGD